MPGTPENVLEIALLPFVPKEGARLLLALKLFETGRLSAGQAAQVGKRAFLEIASRSGAPVANYFASELASESRW